MRNVLAVLMFVTLIQAAQAGEDNDQGGPTGGGGIVTCTLTTVDGQTVCQ